MQPHVHNIAITHRSASSGTFWDYTPQIHSKEVKLIGCCCGLFKQEIKFVASLLTTFFMHSTSLKHVILPQTWHCQVPFICKTMFVAAVVANLSGPNSVDMAHHYNSNYILGSLAQRCRPASKPSGWRFINDLHCRRWCDPACPFLILPLQFSWQHWWHQTYSSVALSPWGEKVERSVTVSDLLQPHSICRSSISVMEWLFVLECCF